MWYAQEYEIEETKCAEKVSLLVNGKWLEGELRDLSHNQIPLPHFVRKGERYLIVAKDDSETSFHIKSEGGKNEWRKRMLSRGRTYHYQFCFS